MKKKDPIQEIIDVLHRFHAECLKEPLEGYPLERRGRKERYAREIIQHTTNTLKRKAEEIERLKKTGDSFDDKTENEKGLSAYRYNQALEDALKILNNE